MGKAFKPDQVYFVLFSQLKAFSLPKLLGSQFEVP